ncbi:T9SS type A sorting domain-containing protein [Flavobacterium sp.]|uniref:type IX secretion system anionic LPS delivery protein PorZ n=1 Tax=Flavobacterium sp. TaxID=239 RepID=UPI002621AFAD|nr:T9SS type A sorting domain-containing protein [Flavobacterium sp.]
MKVFFLTVFSMLAMLCCQSQNNKSWKGYFSYNQINDISQNQTKIFAATENAIFSEDVASGDIKIINTVDGLSGLTITAVYHSQTLRKTIIGYENGLIIVYNEADGSILNVVDIINKSIPQNVKKVNHFMDHNGMIYVSCDFGIVQYNLNTLQFGDTYFIGPNGSQINIQQTAIFNGRLCAASKTNGILVGELTNPNLNDYNQWITVAGFGWSGIEKVDDKLVAVTTSGSLQRWNGTAFVAIAQLPETANDIRTSGAYLLVTTKKHVYLYNTALSQIADINSNQIPDFTVEFTCATILGSEVFFGTEEHGIFSKELNGAVFENKTPEGPLRNNVFAINSTPSALWTVFGGYDLDYNPYAFTPTGLAKFGVSKYDKNGWYSIPYESLLGAKALSRITVNPNNEKQVYLSSFYSGLLKLENDIPTTLYNTSNTGSDGLQTIPGEVPDDIRVNGAVFDKTGNLWVTNGYIRKGLKVLKTNGQWQSYDMQNVAASVANLKFGRMIIDKNGTKWMATWRDGVIGFNENYNNRFKVISDKPEDGNLPSFDARAIAIDNRNQLWIGTLAGLRVLPSIDSFLSNETLKTNAIIIIEDNLAQELLYEQSISDIFVDGANNKWIGTVDAGVFYVSSDGQKTIYHFTSENSPLPSNTINDIEVNGATGEVFFATTKGMVSFRGISTSANEDLNNAYVYPNPVRPEYTGTVKVSGLMDKVHVKIADIEGNLVYETISEGGTIEWDTTAFGKYKVASGVYMIFISSEDGAETKVKKVMIIR